MVVYRKRNRGFYSMEKISINAFTCGLKKCREYANNDANDGNDLLNIHLRDTRKWSPNGPFSQRNKLPGHRPAISKIHYISSLFWKYFRVLNNFIQITKWFLWTRNIYLATKHAPNHPPQWQFATFDRRPPWYTVLHRSHWSTTCPSMILVLAYIYTTYILQYSVRHVTLEPKISSRFFDSPQKFTTKSKAKGHFEDSTWSKKRLDRDQFCWII